MGSDAAAVSAAAAIAVALLILYAVAVRRERGQNPHWAKEVYLCDSPGAAAEDVAAKYDAEVATARQVEVYRGAGGRRPPAGVPAGGVWLYGAKPRRGTRGVAPFGGGRWFQPG
jgi:hypothetical protein